MKFGRLCLKIFVLLSFSLITAHAMAQSGISLSNISHTIDDRGNGIVDAGDTVSIFFDVENLDNQRELVLVIVDPGMPQFRELDRGQIWGRGGGGGGISSDQIDEGLLMRPKCYIGRRLHQTEKGRYLFTDLYVNKYQPFSVWCSRPSGNPKSGFLFC